MSKRNSRLVKGEVELWRGRQWRVTTLGVEMHSYPWTRLPWEVARRGLADPVFNKNVVALSWYSQRHEVDIEDLIEAYAFLCRRGIVPDTHFARACEAARKRNEAARQRHALREEEIRASDKPEWMVGMWMDGQSAA